MSQAHQFSKSLRAGIFLALILALAVSFVPSAQALPSKLGDLDGDNQATVLDLVLLINHARGASLLPTGLAPFADLNSDGLVNQADVDRLMQSILGLLPLPDLPKPVVIDPPSGSSEVGVMVRPKATFVKPVKISSLNSNNFYASFAGQKLPATISPANDGSFAVLFISSAMPNASQITVTVDGGSITNADGTLLDADGNGQPGGARSVSFSTTSVTPVPGTTLKGKIVEPGPDLIPRTADDMQFISGGVQYTKPVAHVKVYLLGMETNSTFTDTNGTFFLTNMPVGDVKVVLDGRTATNAPPGFYFPEMVMDSMFTAGITNVIMFQRDSNGVVILDSNNVPKTVDAFYLPRLTSNLLQSVTSSTNTMVKLTAAAAYTLPTNQQQFLTIQIASNSLVGSNGQAIPSAQIGVSVVPPELVRDMLPPGVLQHTFDITVQALGVSAFSTPAPMTFPNVFNSPPGTKLNFLSFNHTTGRLEIDGTATVSPDGLSVVTDPGTGITHPGWHGLTPPGAGGGGDKPKGGGSGGGGGGGGGGTDGGSGGGDGNGGGGDGSGGGDGGGGDGNPCPPGMPCFDPFPPGGPGGPNGGGGGPSGGGGGPIPTGGVGVTTTGGIPSSPSDNFQIIVRFMDNNLTQPQRTNVLTAARRWEQIIKGDLPNVNTDIGVVDDLVIDIFASPIDGANNILARGGPTYIRTTSSIPARGSITFDTADVSNMETSGRLVPLATHEIGHVLGIGSVWTNRSLLNGPGGVNPQFTGASATAQFNVIFGSNVTSVPVENTGGAGTADSHWRESVFNHELMTGFLEASGPFPLSRVTVGSLADLGYQVNLGAADAYTAGQLIGDGSGKGVDLLPIGGDSIPDVPVVVTPVGILADFGTTNSPVEPGYVQVTAQTIYNTTTKYGWAPSSAAAVSDVDRGSNAATTALTQDFISTQDATFLLDVTNGSYDVTTVIGDVSSSINQAMIFAEGDLRGNLSTIAGQFATNTARVTVGDGQLTLRFKSASGPIALCSLKVNQVAIGLTNNLGSGQLQNLSGKFFFAIENLDTGFILRDSRNLSLGQSLCPSGVFLSANNRYRQWVFQVANRRVGMSEFVTPASGQNFDMPVIQMGSDESTDTDGDGLSDLAEWIIGTNPNVRDSDGDGVSDFAEVQQGLNPLDNRGFANGVIANLPLLGEAKEVILAAPANTPGQVAYIASGSRGMSIVDASQFQMPILMGRLDLPGDCQDIAVDTTLGVAVVAGGAGGLHFVNIANPLSPKLIATVSNNVTQVEVVRGIAYATVGTEVWSYDLQTQSLLQTLALGGNTLTGLASEGLFVYTMDTSSRLRVIDITEPLNMVARGTLNSTSGSGKLFVGNGIAYIAAEGSFAGGFSTANVGNPNAPVLLSGVDSTSVAGRTVIPNGSGLAVTVGSPGNLGNVLQVMDVSNPSNTAAFLTQYTLPADPFSVAIGSGIAYVADGTAGLQVVNYRSFDNLGVAPTITLTNSFQMLSTTNGTAEEGKTVLVSAITTDDVQVRDVQFFIDGVRRLTDVSFPFEFRFVTPAVTNQTNFTLRAIVTDTGGNTNSTPLITVALTPDATPPQILRAFPATNSITTNANSVVVFFTEPIAASSLTTTNFQLIYAGPDVKIGTSDDVLLTNGVVSVRDSVNGIAIQFSTNLPPGLYQVRIGSGLTDRAGNALVGTYSYNFWILMGSASDDDDDDGLTNAQEIALGTNPFVADTDGDGWTDGVEYYSGSNPLNPNSRPMSNLRANPQATVTIVSADNAGAPGSGVYVARPPLQLTLTSADNAGAPGSGVYIARPPLQVTLTSADNAGAPGSGVYLARPPLQVTLTSADNAGAPGSGTYLARPPLLFNFPSADQAGVIPGTTRAYPPAKILLNPPIKP